jgi:predicted nuclease of predicted toxin-antitoxin system
MIIWIDAQLSPTMANWISENCGVQAMAVRELGLRDVEDRQIFGASKQAGATVMTKDRDFVLLLDELGGHPKSSGSPVVIHPTYDSRKSSTRPW